MEYKQASKVFVYTLLLNWLVAASKIVYGIMTRSASMTADGFHSFADGTSNIVGLVGFYVASRPVDKNHPYGHEKYETLTALGIGAFLMFVAFDILRGTIIRFGHPVVPVVTLGSFAIMFITVGINIFVMIYESREGKRLKSDLLTSDSFHTRGDILVSCSVIITLVGVKLGVPMIDTIVSGLIALFIAYSGGEIIWETSRVLTDVAMIEPEKLKKVVTGIEEVKSCQHIRSRGRADNIYVDLHITVDPAMRTDDSHKLTHKIEKILKEKFPGIKEVISHVEPFK